MMVAMTFPLKIFMQAGGTSKVDKTFRSQTTCWLCCVEMNLQEATSFSNNGLKVAAPNPGIVGAASATARY
jgi:hypothetical protein